LDRFDAVYVATDDERIAEAARDFGADVLMTSDTCRNGTERCAEALGLLGDGVEMVVNLQGDAPLTPPWFLDALVDGLRNDSQAALATPILRCDGATLAAFKADRGRGAWAAPRRSATAKTARSTSRRRSCPSHVDAYAPEDETRRSFTMSASMPIGPGRCMPIPTGRLGDAGALEGLEQLRFLEAGHKVLCVEVEARGRKFWELNNPEDIPRIEAMMAEMGME
jgi:3-deoxy-manno-octulosonate cytidylyltransferase (CMP-KDO synthetase)